MYRRLFLAVICCLFFTTILSLECYTEADGQCILIPDMKDCEGEPCQCTKYRFQCTKDDQACTEHEQATKVKKWAYTILPASVCEYIQSQPNVYEEVTCCSTNGCNKPNSGKCLSPHRRRY